MSEQTRTVNGARNHDCKLIVGIVMSLMQCFSDNLHFVILSVRHDTCYDHLRRGDVLGVKMTNSARFQS